MKLRETTKYFMINSFKFTPSSNSMTTHKVNDIINSSSMLIALLASTKRTQLMQMNRKSKLLKI